MEDNILKLLGRKDYVPSRLPQLLEKLQPPSAQKARFQQTVRLLEQAGRIARVDGDRYVLPAEAGLIAGRIQITRQGRGFLNPEDPGTGEIAIPAGETGTALHDDLVLVRRQATPSSPPPSGGCSQSGTVVRVLERRRTQFVGTYRCSKERRSVVPDDPRMHHEIHVPPPRDVGRPARAGDKVVVELRKWNSRDSHPEGVVTEVLGPPNAEGVDMLGVLRHYGLPLKFPPQVLHEVRNFGREVTGGDLTGRTDCRSHPVITIDPEEARDFDDAICLQRVSAKRWKLWVHIADVSHYVKPGSALDREALKRGNSTYLVDRVIPMLPEALSNELCSLKPRVDRLTKCVEFLISHDGKVLSSRCYPAVIHSQRRYSYEEALAVLVGSPTDELEEMLQEAGRLAQIIRKRRFESGSLELDFPESRIRLDERGRVRSIEKVANDASHHLIEEFMLLANEAVATRLIKLKRPTLHRAHEKPDPFRLREYREEVLSHNVPCGNLENPAEVRKLLQRLGDLAIGPALKIGFLKSLMRARYAVESLGHYGLAKQRYAHFTSPIRRYADLVVHRSLFESERVTKSPLAQTAEHVSATERNSADAERDSRIVKLHAFLEAQLNSGTAQRYEAHVTEIRNFGIFVEVEELGMSGLVPLSLLADDFYDFDAARLQVRGRRHRRVIQLGDRLEVEVARVDPVKRQVDFLLVPLPGREKQGGQKTGPRRGNGKPKRKGTPPRRSGAPKTTAKRQPAPTSQKNRPATRRRRPRKPAPQNG